MCQQIVETVNAGNGSEQIRGDDESTNLLKATESIDEAKCDEPPSERTTSQPHVSIVFKSYLTVLLGPFFVETGQDINITCAGVICGTTCWQNSSLH